MMHAPTPAAAASQTRLGLAQGLGAHLLWGLLPLYFLLLKGVSAGEIVTDRIVWSLVLVLVIVVATGRGRALRAALAAPRTLAILAFSAALISINWLVFIWAALHHHVLEASLGYFLSPLLSVVLGVFVLRERLSRVQIAAVALAAAGVAVMATGAGGQLWISLVLAASFGLYGLVRKVAPVEALEGLTVETIVLTPFALGYVAWLHAGGTLAFGRDAQQTLLLMLGGVVTAVPLLLFAAAARKLPLSVLGLLQYLTPTLQFVLAITVFGEPLAVRTIVCFALIWSGLALYVVSSLRSGPRLAEGARAT